MVIHGIRDNTDMEYLKSDKGRRKLDASGPTPDNIRTIPYFSLPTASASIAVSIEPDSGPPLTIETT